MAHDDSVRTASPTPTDAPTDNQRRGLGLALLGALGALSATSLAACVAPNPPESSGSDDDELLGTAQQRSVGALPVKRVDTILGAVPPATRTGDLATCDATTVGADVVVASGCLAAGDGGGGLFYWDPSSSSGDDGGTIIVPSTNPSGGRWRRIYSGPLNLKWFGAIGDGATADDVPIQNALAAAMTGLGQEKELSIPRGMYKVTSTIQITAGGYRGLIIRGEGANCTQIWYSGTGTAVNTSLISGFLLSDLAIMQKGTTRTGNGLVLGGSGVGSQTHAGEIQRVLIDGFQYGILAGDPGFNGQGAASEVHYSLVRLNNCDYGWFSVQLNTITHIFTLCGATYCGYGFYIDVPLAVHFRGGSVGHNTVSDFYVRGRGGAVTITGMDSETSAKFLVTDYSNAQTQVTVTGCEIREPVNTDDVTIDNSKGINLVLKGNTFGNWVSSKVQKIQIGSSGNEGYQFTMKENYVNASEAFVYVGSYYNVQFDVSMNQGKPAGGSPGAYFDDENGYFRHGVGKIVLHRQRRPKSWPYTTSTTNTQALLAVTGISGSETEALNLRGTAPISGTDQSYAVSFSTAEPDAAYFLALTVVDGTPSTTAAGARRAYVTSKSASGFTINLEAAPGSGSSVNVDWHLIR